MEQLAALPTRELSNVRYQIIILEAVLFPIPVAVANNGVPVEKQKRTRTRNKAHTEQPYRDDVLLCDFFIIRASCRKMSYMTRQGITMPPRPEAKPNYLRFTVSTSFSSLIWTLQSKNSFHQ